MPLRVGCRADDSDKHELDVNFLLYHKGTLYSAGDDGKIKSWAPDLKKIAEVVAHPCSVYCLAANEDTLFSCSNEGTVKSFDLTSLKEQTTLIRDEQTEFWRVSCSQGCLYSGDCNGFIRVWKDGKMYGSLNIAEPVKDMAIHGTMVFTAKDLDLVITHIKLEGEKLQYGTKNSFPGRAPVAVIGDELFGFTSRNGNDIVIHENNPDSHFKSVTKVEGAHEKIINALSGTKWNDKTVIFSGGWDKQVKKWIFCNDKLTPDGACDIEFVINTIALGDEGEIYVGGEDGHIVRVQIE